MAFTLIPISTSASDERLLSHWWRFYRVKKKANEAAADDDGMSPSQLTPFSPALVVGGKTHPAIAKPKDRTLARALCSEYAARNDYLGWFDALYQKSRGDAAAIPWADMVPNPHLCAWHRETNYDFRNRRCLKIGCGLGDDAEYLALAGGRVVAFDISPTAIDWCRQRFPDSTVDYVTSDLFTVSPTWHGSFDFVFESYTLQVLPPDLRDRAIRCIAALVGLSGTLLVVCRGREESESRGTMPWPITQKELLTFSMIGLRESTFEDYADSESPPVRRFRVRYDRTV
jgi:SAM-dependent methyltransferase